MPRSKNRNAPVGDRQSRTAPKGQKRGPNPRAIVEFPQPLAADWIDPPTIPEAAPERRSIRLSISRLGSELGLLRPEAQSCRVVAVEAVTFADDRPVQIEAAFPVARRRPLAGGSRAAEISARSYTSLLLYSGGLWARKLSARTAPPEPVSEMACLVRFNSHAHRHRASTERRLDRGNGIHRRTLNRVDNGPPSRGQGNQVGDDSGQQKAVRHLIHGGGPWPRKCQLDSGFQDGQGSEVPRRFQQVDGRP